MKFTKFSLKTCIFLQFLETQLYNFYFHIPFIILWYRRPIAILLFKYLIQLLKKYEYYSHTTADLDFSIQVADIDIFHYHETYILPQRHNVMCQDSSLFLLRILQSRNFYLFFEFRDSGTQKTICCGQPFSAHIRFRRSIKK